MNIEHKCLIIKNYEGDTKEFTELLNTLEKNHICNRNFCYFCLKGNYDTLAENIKDNNTWLCPYCAGTCYCSRCMRNEKILQLIAYYFSIDGDIIYLNTQLTSMNSIIDELFNNYVLSNIYMIIYDKNATPTQMVNNFMNFDSEKYSDELIQEKENEIYNLKKYIETLTKQKELIHNEFIKFCKDKYEVKNKYNLIDNKNKNNTPENISINNNKLNLEENNKNNEKEINNVEMNDIKLVKEVDSMND